MRIVFTFMLLIMAICLRAEEPAPPVHFVTPEGSGTKDGSSWENSFPGNDGGLQKSWDTLPAGGTLFLSGTYEKVTLIVHEGGTSLSKLKRLVGVDRGKGLPAFQGTWSKETPAKGSALIVLSLGASFLEIHGLDVRNYRNAIDAKGRHEGLRISGLTVLDCRDAIVLNGGATAEAPEHGSRDIVVEDCQFSHYTKRGLRIQEGNRQVRVIHCIADAGGKENAAEVFPIGFHIAGNQSSGTPGISDQDIVFIDCESRNNFQSDAPDKYWNADGFASESNAIGLTFIRCRAFDNTDGGWDLKTPNAVLVDRVAARNKRNYRIWSKPGPTVMINCSGDEALLRGGSGTAAGLHVCGGVVHAYHCLFRNNHIGVDLDHAGALLEMVGSSVSAEKTDAVPSTIEAGGTLRFNGEQVSKLTFTAGQKTK